MNYTKSLVGALAALATGVCMFGQTAATQHVSAGLLGKRYAAVGLFVEDFRDLPLDNGIGGALSVNLPVAANVDAGFGYSYERVDDVVDIDAHTLGATVRAYTDWSGVRPFADATLGYVWADADGPAGLGVSFDEALWELGVGVEIPVAAATSLTARVSYEDLFENGYEGSWAYTVGVNHWFTQQVAGNLRISFLEDDSVVYGAGVAFRF